jgi:hypothetical protein
VSSALVDKRRLDVVSIFLHYVASVGDVERTALACDLDPSIVRKLAVSEGWEDKIRRLTMVSKSSGMQAGEYERMQNRALAWVGGHRLRQVLDKVICNLHSRSEDELLEEVTSVDRDGHRRMSARVFTDLAKALETVNGLCFAALGDTIPERKAASPDAAASTAALHSALIAALNGPGGGRGVPSEQLVIDASEAIDGQRQIGTGETAHPSENVKPEPDRSTDVGGV